MLEADNVLPVYLSRKFTVAPDGCWEWTGARHRLGYGVVKVAGKQWAVHRYVDTLMHGEIPAGVHVLHQCDNPLCANPDHLFRGSHATNMADKQSKGRAPRGEAHASAKLTEAQVVAIRAKYAQGDSSYALLAEEYGTSKHNIAMIVKRRTWAHI